ncbi:DNA internalization-related competence protein ComEC/Rec2 [Companilactobacillus jidongensis]|uniref:DNA internalization-related competence protein ComEC/Rec2 n=1 Tax=Companilactobacillus jidongensis TaxID=2486006 RepID=UPI000F780CBC|nr:DNA internalization-related competence protein ComEC/Rec2 [Companilactobacillus jidongensis]
MMKDLLIFPAMVGCLSVAIVFEGNYFLMLLLLVLTVRIILLKNGKIIVVSIFIGMLLAVEAQILKSDATQPNNIDSLMISPDKVKISGDLLSGIGTNNNHDYNFFYRIKSEDEKKLWQRIDKISDLRIKIKSVKKINPPRNPGEFDYAKYLEHHKIKYRLFVDEIKKITPKQRLSLKDNINVLRIHLIQKFSQLPKWLRIHADSLLLGYNNNEEPNFLSNLSTLGIIHLFSLSGLHVLILLAVFRKICSILKITRESVDNFMLILLPTYAILVGSKPGIWRAIILAIVGIICQKLNVSVSKLDVFGITAVICLLINPYSMMDMGGQLSFLLSFALLFLYNSNIIMGTIKMNIVSLPIIIYSTFQISWLTLLANIIFVPIFTYIILPVTIISAFTVTSPVWNYFNNLFEQLYSIINMIAKNNNYLFVTGTIPILVVFILIGLSLFIAENKGFGRKYFRVYALILAICILFNKYPLHGKVSIIDVGQGDSILITTPLLRKTYLIDTGGKIGFPKKQWQKREQLNQVETSTIPYLRRQGIRRIDKVFLSHKDVDHIGNLNTLVSKFPINEINFGTGLEQNKMISELIATNPQIRFNKLKTGDRFVDGKIVWNVLWPQNKAIGENGDSLTLLASINGSKWLFTGDLDINGEQKIISQQNFKVDYLKVGHHGSKTSSSDEFIKQINPKLALISAGVNNRYGHPNKETIERLNKNRVAHMNTADYGMIIWYYSPFDNKNGISTFLKGEVVEDSRIKT